MPDLPIPTPAQAHDRAALAAGLRALADEIEAGARQAVSLARAIGRDWEPREASELPDLPTDAGDPARAAATRADLRRLLAGLPAADRRLLWLRIGLEWSAREVADELGTTPGAVRVAQHRALQRARRLVARPRPGGVR